MTTLEWLNNKISEGKGNVEFGITENGNVGIWHKDNLVGCGDTAEEALQDAAYNREASNVGFSDAVRKDSDAK